MSDHTSNQWVLSIDRSVAANLIALYGIEGIQILDAQQTDDTKVWVRGNHQHKVPQNGSAPRDDNKHLRSAETGDSSSTNSIHCLLRSIFAAVRYELLPDGQLVPMGQQVPVATLPKGKWVPFPDWYRPHLPVARLPARATGNRVKLKAVRANIKTSVDQPNLLMCSLDDWHAFVETAAQIRLKQLQFVCDHHRNVFVSGVPLPAIRGERFIQQDQVAVSAGWTWYPHVNAATVKQILGLGSAETSVLFSDGSWSIIADHEWVQAWRAAVRATSRSFEAEQCDSRGSDHDP